jgi:hypothetical protein
MVKVKAEVKAEVKAKVKAEVKAEVKAKVGTQRTRGYCKGLEYPPLV